MSYRTTLSSEETVFRYPFLAIALVVLGGVPAAAAVLPCASGTLTSYINLGTTGCTVGNLAFNGFEGLAQEPGTTAIPTGSVTVTPVSSGLSFVYNQTTTSGAILDSVFGFDVNALLGGRISGETLNLNGSSASGFGGVAGIGNVCAGAVSVTGSCAASAARSLGVDSLFGITQFTDQVSFTPLPLVGQEFDFSADSSSGGAATLGAAVATFAITPAPEPSTLCLTGGLVVLAFFRRWKLGA